jgi:hypothetical protein
MLSKRNQKIYDCKRQSYGDSKKISVVSWGEGEGRDQKVNHRGYLG